MNTLSNTKSIYTLEDPVWLHESGMDKGRLHDRQALGFILDSGAKLEIRQANTDVNKELTLRLLNDDQKKEEWFSVGSDWITINSSAVSVPFIDTPYFEGKPIIEYRYPENSKTLPVYRKNDNEATFFETWDKQKSEFSLIDSDYFLMLVPQCDKESLRHLKSFDSIDKLIHYYESVFVFYNDLSGISFYPKRLTDKNIPNKYFIKADKHGAGGGYYGSNWTAANASSIAGFWLDDLQKNWGHLHEIAHGYEGWFMKNSACDVEEVWNNIYAASYQNTCLDKKMLQQYGWLGSRTEEIFGNVKNYLEQKTPVNNWGFFDKLFFMMLMKNKAGPEAFTYLNQQYRELFSNLPDEIRFNPPSNTLMDMISDSYATIGKIDVIPFIQMVGGELSPRQCLVNQLNHEKVVYPLCELVNSNELTGIQAELNLKSPFTLVDPLDLKRTSLTGNLNIAINIDQFKEIYAEELSLMQGQNPLLTTKIDKPYLEFNNIPIGVYTLSLPTGKNIKYSIDKKYAIVKQGSNELVVDYSPKIASPLLSQSFYFFGKDHDQFGKLSVDFSTGKITLNITKSIATDEFDKKIYAKIVVKNALGECCLSKEIEGNNLSIGTEQISFKAGHNIEIFCDKSVQLMSDSKSFFLDGGRQHNFYIWDNVGLQQLEDQPGNNPGEDLEERIAATAESIRQQNHWMTDKYMPLKDDIYLAIQDIYGINNNKPSNPNRAIEFSAMMEKYKDVIPTDNEIPGDYVGNKFTISLRGLADRIFFSMNIDKVEKNITFETFKVKPNSSFQDKTYAAVRYIDSSGVEKYNYDFIGDNELQADKKSFKFSSNGEERLFIHHQEPHRYKLYNAMQDKLIPLVNSKDNIVNVTYQFAHNGLTELNADSPQALSLPQAAITGRLMQAIAARRTPEFLCTIGDLLRDNYASSTTGHVISTMTNSI